jgi:hypothetical protein
LQSPRISNTEERVDAVPSRRPLADWLCNVTTVWA